MSDFMKKAYEEQEGLRKSLKNIRIINIERLLDENIVLNLEDGRKIEICYNCHGGVSLYNIKDKVCQVN